MAEKRTETTQDFNRDFGRVDKKMLAEVEAFAMEAGEFDQAKIQRRFKLKYSQMANIIKRFEKRGILGPYSGSIPRRIIFSEKTP